MKRLLFALLLVLACGEPVAPPPPPPPPPPLAGFYQLSSYRIRSLGITYHLWTEASALEFNVDSTGAFAGDARIMVLDTLQDGNLRQTCVICRIWDRAYVPVRIVAHLEHITGTDVRIIPDTTYGPDANVIGLFDRTWTLTRDSLFTDAQDPSGDYYHVGMRRIH